MINPADREQTIGKAGLNVGHGMKQRPVNRVKLRCAPRVDPTHMLDLRLVVGVRKRRTADVSDLGGEFTRDCPGLDR